MNELDPISAVIAPDPYSYYARLVKDTPLYRDDRIGMWVATSALAVEAALSCTALRVRPASEPVPKALVGSAVGEIFSRMVRMTDGPVPLALKAAMVGAMDRGDWQQIASIAATSADELASNFDIHDPATVSAFLFGLPALVTAKKLGFSHRDAASAMTWARAFVRLMVTEANADERADGNGAVASLRSAVQQLCDDALDSASFLGRFLAETRAAGIADGDALANVVGLFFQGYEGTAGLIGNALVAPEIRSESFRRELFSDDRLLDGYVAEIARFDSPVHNTRRFAAEDVTLLDAHILKGDTLLVVLAAANRDPLVNRDPARFEPLRENRRMYTFGFGPHACPGTRMATAIAAAGLHALLRRGADIEHLPFVGYLPRGNVRVPMTADPRG